jgi:predicted O-methyltransferase YrrM
VPARDFSRATGALDDDGGIDRGGDRGHLARLPLMRARVLRLGLATILGLKKRGFFIPYRYADQVPAPKDRAPYAALEAIFAEAEPSFAALLKSMGPYADAFRAIGSRPPPEPRWDQDWFPRLDAASLYVFVREAKPARIVEVGSGHSTRFMARAVRDGAFSSAMTAIDPAPRADIGGTGATLIRKTVQEAGPEPFAALAEGDILFIDSSHILMPGTDVDFLFNRILPALRRGVLVHVHDVFLPDDYPAEWDWRGYNEQLGVAGLIQGGGYRLLWSSHYAATRMRDAIATSIVRTIELKPGAFEASLWMVKV